MFVTIYVNKLLSELLAPKDTTFNVTDYTNNPTLFDTAHSMKQTLEKHLLIDIAAIREMTEKNAMKLVWMEKEKQISDVLTKSRVSSTFCWIY